MRVVENISYFVHYGLSEHSS